MLTATRQRGMEISRRLQENKLVLRANGSFTRVGYKKLMVDGTVLTWSGNEGKLIEDNPILRSNSQNAKKISKQRLVGMEMQR